MEKEVKIATLVDEDGVEYELEVIKEFDHNDKKYAVLYEGYCEEECDCHEEPEEEHDSEEEDDCEGHIYVLEVVKDEEGNEVYNEIEASVMEELIPIIEKKLYPTEE